MPWVPDILPANIRAEAPLITAALRVDAAVNVAIASAKAEVENFLRSRYYNVTNPATDADVWNHCIYLTCAKLLYSIYGQEGFSEEYQGAYRDYSRRWILYKREVVDGYRMPNLAASGTPTPGVSNIPLSENTELSQFDLDTNQPSAFPIHIEDDEWT